MQDENLTIARRRELVMIAIGRIEAIEKAEEFIDGVPRELVKRAAENEFGWQWKNVRAILTGENK